MATARRFCRCACFCSQNLYVARYGLHLRFRNEQQLRRDYGPVSGVGGAGSRGAGRAANAGGGARTPGLAFDLSLQRGRSLASWARAWGVRGTRVFTDLWMIASPRRGWWPLGRGDV